MRLGQYEIGSPIGRGGMGAVYQARSPDGGEVAIKVLLRNDPERLARFEREARLLASLGVAEGFVPLLDSGSSPQGPYIVMPLLAGGTLRARMAQGPLRVEETIEIGRALARALGAAHAHGIVHRDMKPENVLWHEGRPLVADLGLAKHWDSDAPGASQSVSLSSHGELRGTAGYMAPEQIEDARTAGPPADVFALGAILYECLAGEPPFVASSPFEAMARVTSGVFEPLRRRRSDVPGWLAVTIERALAPLSERWADGLAFARALEPSAVRRSNRALVASLATLALAVGGLVFILVPRGRPVSSATPAPRSKTPSVAEQVAAIVQQGRQKADTGDVDGARILADRALALDPRSAPAWVLSGFLHLLRGETDPAISDETRAIELDPSLSVAWSNRAAARVGNRDFQGELEDAERALQLEPKNAAAWIQRGKAHGALNDLAGEIADYSRALDIDPGVAVAWLNRAAARADQNDLEGAIDDSTRAIALDGKLGAAWMNRGIARAKKNDLAGAIDDLTKGLDIDPSVPMGWLARAQARERLGDVRGAALDYEAFLARAPHDLQAPAVRQRLESLSGRRREANR